MVLRSLAASQVLKRAVTAPVRTVRQIEVISSFPSLCTEENPCYSPFSNHDSGGISANRATNVLKFQRFEDHKVLPVGKFSGQQHLFPSKNSDYKDTVIKSSTKLGPNLGKFGLIKSSTKLGPNLGEFSLGSWTNYAFNNRSKCVNDHVKRSNSTIATAAITTTRNNEGEDKSKSQNTDENENNKTSLKENEGVVFENCPKMAMARAMPLSVRDVGNDVLFGLASRGHNDACCEVLRRHIMVTDNVSYETAEETLKRIRVCNSRGQAKTAYTHVLLIASSVIAGFASFLLVFDINSVLYFNEHFVTMAVPDPKELDTTLEVGAWSWNWMEPPLGQISFFLLCMQFAKGECEFLGIDPLHDWYLNKRAERLAREFPQYNSRILRYFSLSEKFFKRKNL